MYNVKNYFGVFEIYHEKIFINIELKGTVSFVFFVYPNSQFILKLDVPIEGIPEEIIVFSSCGCVRKGDKILLKGNIVKFKEKYFKKEFMFSTGGEFWNETLQCGGIIPNAMAISKKRISKKLEVHGTVSLVIGFDFKIKLDEPIEGIPDEIFVGRAGLVREGDKIHLMGELMKYTQKYFKKEYFVFLAKHLWNETLQCGHTRIDTHRT